MSQTEAQDYRERVRAQLVDELSLHNRTTCQYCTNGAACLELYYAQRAQEIVEKRLSRDPRGPAGTTAADREKTARAVRDALERLALRRARVQGVRPRNAPLWPALDNERRNTL